MNLLNSSKDHGYCAFCRSPKWIYRSKNVGFMGFAIALFASLCVGVVAFHEFNPLVVVVFVSLIVIVELFVLMRWRLSVICKACGFDPLLYKKSHQLAAEKVKQHLERRSQSADYLLSRPLNLPTRVQQEEEKPKASAASAGKSLEVRPGSRVSKQV